MEILEPSLVSRIVDEALSVLEKTGVLVENPHAFARLVDVGFKGNEETHRITFPRKSLEEALASAPSSLTLHDRDGNPSATLEGDHVHFVPASSALRILDRKTQEIREGDSKDFVDYVKIADGLKNISYLSTAFIPRDIPQDIADAWRLYMVLSFSKRPIVSGAFTHFGVPRMGELMSYFREGREDLVKKPMSIFTCCPNTPLALGRGSHQQHHRLRGVGNPDRDRAGAAPRDDLPLDHRRSARAPYRGGGERPRHRPEDPSGNARSLRRRSRELPHAAHDEPHDRGRSAPGLLRLRPGGEVS